MRDSELQQLTSKQNIEGKLALARIIKDTKIEMEKLRHKNIMEEIEAMKKAKITQFVRQVKEKGASNETKPEGN